MSQKFVFGKLFVLCTVLTLSSVTSLAGLPGLASTYTRHLSGTRARIAKSQLLNTQTPKTCHQQILDISQDGQIDIMMAFGYMDVSLGQEFEDTASSLYGPGDVLDLDAKEAMENMLLSSCRQLRNFACGFRRSGDVFVKTIRDRFTGKRLKVSVTLKAPSASASDQKNRSTLANKQAQLSENTRRHFLSAVQTHDVVIYMGHARSGGGPDFLPPVLTNNGYVNYGHYKSQQKGIRDLLGALQSAPRPPKVVGLLACKSTGLFAQRVRRASPSSILVTADNLFDYNDILPTGYAMLEAAISQRCTQSFEDLVKIQPASQHFLRLFL